MDVGAFGHCVALLKLATTECRNIISGQLEPFTVHATIGEAAMPISLNSCRIIGSYDMFKYHAFWQRDRNLFDAPFERIGTANFVVRAGTQ